NNTGGDLYKFSDSWTAFFRTPGCASFSPANTVTSSRLFKPCNDQSACNRACGRCDFNTSFFNRGSAEMSCRSKSTRCAVQRYQRCGLSNSRTSSTDVALLNCGGLGD